MRAYQQRYMIMFPGSNIENNFYERIKTLNALLIIILPRFKMYFIDTRIKQGVFIQQSHHPAILIGTSDTYFFPVFVLLAV